MGESIRDTQETPGNLAASGYRCTLSGEPLTVQEQRVFEPSLDAAGAAPSVWKIYDAVSRVSTPRTQARILRVYDGAELAGAALMLRCKAWAESLFAPPLLHLPVDALRLPAHIWIRVGYCAEGIANPGFVARGHSRDAVIDAMLEHLKHHALGSIVTDTVANAGLHKGASRFPYVNDGRVVTAGMRSIEDFLGLHNNLVRKLKWFAKRGGRIETIRAGLDAARLPDLRRFIRTTVEKSVIHSPFQDCFEQIVERTSTCDSTDLVHFLAYLDGAPVGHHTFVRAGRTLRMIHGAFDRSLPKTHHAYENLLVESVRFALAEGVESIHYGPVLNETKRRMMTHTEPAALYFYSNNPIIRTVIPRIFPYTRMQSRKLLAFSSADADGQT